MATENKWIFNPETDSAIIEEGTEEVVMYTNDVHPEVISKVVQMRNEEYSTKKIDQYLESDDRVTPEECEYIIEQIDAWDHLQKSAPNKTVVHPNDADKPVTSTVVQEERPLEHVPFVEGGVLTEPTTVPKKTRAPKGQGNGPAKKKISVDTLEQSIEDQIKALQEKGQLIKILKSVPAPEFPENLTAAGRKLMLDLQKEHKALIDKYAEAINEMN